MKNQTKRSHAKAVSRDEQTASRDEQTASRDEQTASRDEQTASADEQTASRDEQTASRDEKTASRDEQTASACVLFGRFFKSVALSLCILRREALMNNYTEFNWLMFTCFYPWR